MKWSPHQANRQPPICTVATTTPGVFAFWLLAAPDISVCPCMYKPLAQKCLNPSARPRLLPSAGPTFCEQAQSFILHFGLSASTKRTALCQSQQALLHRCTTGYATSKPAYAASGDKTDPISWQQNALAGRDKQAKARV